MESGPGHSLVSNRGHSRRISRRAAGPGPRGRCFRHFRF